MSIIGLSEEDIKRHSLSKGMFWLVRISQNIGWLLAFFFYKVLNRSRVIGLENIPDDGCKMFASNHVSGVDTLLVPYFVIPKVGRNPILPPAKEELFKNPVMGLIMRALGSYPVKRRSRDYEAMRKSVALARTQHTMIFPEGTRTKTGELLKGRSGVGWIVYQSHPVVIPTLVINTDKFFWPGRKRPWFFIPYTVVFGKPLDLKRFYGEPNIKGTSKAIVGEIMGAISKLKEEHKNLYI